MLSFNALKYSAYEANDLGNIRFYSNTVQNTANELESWCESNCTKYLTNTTGFMYLNINNIVAAPTEAPFQQFISFNALKYSAYEANDLGNIRFYTGVEPDIVVQYSNGIMAGFDSKSNTNLSRGQLLSNIFSTQNLSSGENVYLNSETYNTSNYIMMSGSNGIISNVSLYGAGKHKTIIESTAGTTNTLINMGSNSIVADLSIVAGSFGTAQHPIGSFLNDGTGIIRFGNSIIRNVYVQADSDGIFIEANGGNPITGNLSVYNFTANTLWDTAILSFGGSSNTLKLYVYDSNFITNGASIEDSGANAHGVIDAADSYIYLVNSIISVIGTSSTQTGILTTQPAANVLVYGGSVSVSGSGASQQSIYNQGGIIGINSVVQVHGTESGAITSLGSNTFGLYSYQKNSIAPPAVQFPSELYSWCESNCTSNSLSTQFWVKLPNGILASSNVIINMTFKNVTSSQYHYDGKIAGEAPQYNIQYDNGQNVFLSYANSTGANSFDGGNLCANGDYVSNQQMITYGILTTTAMEVDGGAVSTGACGWEQMFSLDTPITLPNVTVESNFNINVSTNPDSTTAADIGAIGLSSAMSSQSFQNNFIGVQTGHYGTNGQSGTPAYFFEDYANTLLPTPLTYGVNACGTNQSNAWLYAEINYSSYSSTYNGYISPKLYNPSAAPCSAYGTATNLLKGYSTVYIAPVSNTSINTNDNGQVYMFYNWIRARASPPMGVMPTTTFNTIQSSVTILSNSIFWVKLSNPIPASSNSIIYMDFLPTNTEYDSNYAGEAPQLSSKYAKYDNGNQIFNFYDNFQTGDTKWTAFGAATKSYSNSLTLTGSGGLYAPISSGNLIFEDYGVQNPGGSGIWIGYNTPMSNDIGYGYLYWDAGNTPTIYRSTGAGALTSSSSSGSLPLGNFIMGAAFAQSAQNLTYNYTKEVVASDSTYPQSNSVQIAFRASSGNTIGSQWVRVRTYPPNDFMPLTLMENVVNPLTSISFTVSNSPILQGSTQTINAVISGGASPYIYNIIVYNAIGSMIFNSLSQPTLSVSNSVIYLQQTAWGTGTFTANILITDSAQTTASNSLSYLSNSVTTTSISTTISSSTIPQNSGGGTFTGGLPCNPCKATISSTTSIRHTTSSSTTLPSSTIATIPSTTIHPITSSFSTTISRTTTSIIQQPQSLDGIFRDLWDWLKNLLGFK